MTPTVRVAPLLLIWRHSLFALIVVLWFCAVLGGVFLETLWAWSAGLVYVAYDTWLIGFVAWKTRRLRPPPSPDASSGPAIRRPRMSVLIPARDERLVLAGTLDALIAQTDPPDDILLVDDGSSDGTAALLEERYGVPAEPACGMRASTRIPGLRVLGKPNSGKARSLNLALQGLDAEIVVTLDADTRLRRDALAAMRRAFADQPQLMAACGIIEPRCRPGHFSAFFEWFQRFEYLRAFLSRAAWQRIGALLLVSGAFAAYRKSALDTIGGYRDDSLVEDYELIHRLHRHAHECALPWRVEVIGTAHAVTDAPATLPGFLRQRRRWFAGFLQTQFANRDMTGNPRYGAVGRLMLPIKAVDTLQPVFGLTAFALLLFFLFSGSVLAVPVLTVIGIKLAIDFSYQLWAVWLYHRWLGEPARTSTWWLAIGATFAEPFSFQLMRHAGAVLGWVGYLRGRLDWSPQRVQRSAA